jgi:hypothetical protein
MSSASPAQTPTELTATEMAFLALTNPREIDIDARRVVLTAKDGYLWSTLIALFAQSRIDREAVPEPGELIDTVRDSMTREAIEQLLPGQVADSGIPGRRALKRTAKQLLFIEDKDLDPWFEGLVATTNQTYSALVSRGLIEDPFSIAFGGGALIVMGFIPVSFTRQTEQGEQVLLKIKAPFYEFEQTGKGEKRNVDIRFHLLTLIKAFYAGAAGGFKDSWEQLQKGPAHTTRNIGPKPKGGAKRS